jgi:hypothetical protein
MTGQAQKYCENIACLRKRWETAKNDTSIDARNALDALLEEFSKNFTMHIIHFTATPMGTYLTAERFFTRNCSNMERHTCRWPVIRSIFDAADLVREASGTEFRRIMVSYHNGWRIPE